jgi:hypothetical protein
MQVLVSCLLPLLVITQPIPLLWLVPLVLDLELVVPGSPPWLLPLRTSTEVVHQLSPVVLLSHGTDGVVQRRVGLQGAVHLQLGAKPQSKEVDGVRL